MMGKWFRIVRRIFLRNPMEYKELESSTNFNACSSDETRFLELDTHKVVQLENMLMSETFPTDPSMVAFLFAKPPRVTREPK